MVYLKKKKTFYKKKKPVASKKDKQQDQKIKKLESLVRNELKTISTVQETLQLTTACQVVPLTLVATGDSTITREGSAIKGATLNLTYKLFMDGNSAGEYWDPTVVSNAYIRVIVFRDAQPSGVLPTGFTSVLGSGLLFGGSSASLNDQIHLNPYVIDSGRYKIIHDTVHPYRGTAGTQNNNDQRLVSIKKPIRHNIYYSGNDAVIADALKNHYFIAAFIGQAGANYQPYLSFNCQIRFWDV